MRNYNVFYDASCQLCQKTKIIFSKLDWFNKAKWISIQEINDNPSYSFLDKEALEKEMHLISPEGKVYSGFFAVRRLSLAFPLTFFIGLVAYFPLFHYIGIPLYQMIAKNRHKILGGNCENGTCKIRK
ncbi:DUF393 domain-containing protein [Bacillus timonensis]|nr:DUF393 domain-containing protein [Bacillus timonensis]